MTAQYRFKVEKLIRDKVPAIIDQEIGASITYKVLENDDYIASLKDKLVEESHEVILAGNIEEIIDELADLMEVISALTETLGISHADIQQTMKNRKASRGGFSSKIYCHNIEVSEENKERLSYYRERPLKYPEIS